MRNLILSSIWAAVLLPTLSQTASAVLPQPSTTKQLPGVPCSVTAYGQELTARASMTFGGGISCADGVGQKILNVVPQVSKLSHGRRVWFDVSLAGLYQGPTPANPLRLTGNGSFVHGHVYRLLVYGHVRMPDGRQASTTVCSGCAAAATPPPSLSIVGHDPYAPQSPVTVPFKGSPCVVTETGPEFTVVNGSYVNSYGGRTTCPSTVRGGQVRLTLCAEVTNRVNGKDVWFTISGSCLSASGSASAGTQLYTARTAYLGHGYRIKASATITVPSAGGPKRQVATAYSSEWAP
jgi:hypothetical protein